MTEEGGSQAEDRLEVGLPSTLNHAGGAGSPLERWTLAARTQLQLVLDDRDGLVPRTELTDGERAAGFNLLLDLSSQPLVEEPGLTFSGRDLERRLQNGMKLFSDFTGRILVHTGKRQTDERRRLSREVDSLSWEPDDADESSSQLWPLTLDELYRWLVQREEKSIADAQRSIDSSMGASKADSDDDSDRKRAVPTRSWVDSKDPPDPSAPFDTQVAELVDLSHQVGSTATNDQLATGPAADSDASYDERLANAMELASQDVVVTKLLIAARSVLLRAPLPPLDRPLFLCNADGVPYLVPRGRDSVRVRCYYALREIALAQPHYIPSDAPGRRAIQERTNMVVPSIDKGFRRTISDAIRRCEPDLSDANRHQSTKRLVPQAYYLVGQTLAAAAADQALAEKTEDRPRAEMLMEAGLTMLTTYANALRADGADEQADGFETARDHLSAEYKDLTEQGRDHGEGEQ